MNLAEMLSYSDIAELSAIADAYGCECSSHSKNELIQSILSTVQRRDVLESRVGEVTGNDLRFLNSLLFESRTAYSLEELKARAIGGGAGAPEGDGRASNAGEAAALAATKQEVAAKGNGRKKKTDASKIPRVPEDSARQSISRFKRNGWLFNGFSQHTKYLFQVPEDVKARLGDALEKRFRHSLDFAAEPPAYRDEGNLLAEDVTAFLKFVRDNDVPVTAEGVMYKRQLSLALERMSVMESIPTRAGWRFGYGRKFRDYPDRFSLLYDYVYLEGLVEERTDRLELTELGRNVADGFAKAEQIGIYRCWMRQYKIPVPSLPALAQWVMRLTPEWTTVESVIQILQPLVRPYFYDTQRDVLDNRVLRMLMHLGALRWGETESGEAVVKLTKQGKSLISGVPHASFPR
ncbi:hypothetical protein [Cohnella soli]|uniref:Rho termination factor N-terminal domain-containing protein n=1 Tax=Cohnella soli TaxID=425005 RepID=A0ABW0HXP2_9BACL